MTRVIFSYNNKLGSTLIRLGSFLFDSSNLTWENTPSHTALLLNNYWVIESVMLGGVRIIPYDNWKKINVEVASIVVIPEICPENLLLEVWGRKYDYLALLWFVKAVICSKILNTEVPSINKFESEDKYFCTELVGRSLNMEDYSMTTPAKLLTKLINH